ncbi:MAG: SDR family oxidoreductase [Bacteroidetes bacterium]|nr:SDR family oxidoreductase [Bacteroidota bacterium]
MKYTLITGASKGIGKAFAYECAAKGMNLLLVARSESLLSKLAEELSAKYKIAVDWHVADLLDHNAHKKVFGWVAEKGYNVNMLINNAGMGLYGEFSKVDLEDHLKVMHLNMDSLIRMAHEFLTTTDANQKRYLLNTSSSGAYQPVPYMSIYGASKSFVLSFSYALRYELLKKNVHVTALCPGGTETEFFTPAKMEKVVEKNASFMMKPDEVARVGLAGVLANKAAVIPGFINKLSALSVRFAPTDVVTATAATFFKPD